ncbi:MAG: hypothetical protein WC109_05010 [Syntrophomonadaceae bacterium]|nr:hypothetical protein [Syntrophomonadaceae bacterium]MDD3271658.1 hypothetical protein [Syntrophomonadaceae bacterium]MDD3898277.1 hypothetical protein [Syntrophomonadaceae bacterium]MDD4562086.1 hypothetical protein [Syntrophomonadaceae bacterium]
MANEGQVLVEVLHGSHSPAAGGCAGCASAASCGSNIDYAAQTEKLAGDLKGEYGDKIQVNYVDVEKTGLKDYPMINQVLQMGYPYPITLINGEPKFAGGIMLPELKSVIDELLK